MKGRTEMGDGNRLGKRRTRQGKEKKLFAQELNASGGGGHQMAKDAFKTNPKRKKKKQKGEKNKAP